MKKNDEALIRKASVGDTAPVMEIIRETGFFRSVEEEVALEVLEDAAFANNGSYQSYVAVSGGKTAGWVCFGSTPCTLGTFDIYWIAVDLKLQRSGIGSKLLKFAEQEIISQNGRLIVIETSGTEKYRKTQKFYEGNGYRLNCIVDDFYAEGDGKMIYVKKIIGN